MNIKRILSIFALLITSSHFSSLVAAPYSTPNYYQCFNKIGGSWNFGRVPNACDVNPWGDPQYVIDNFTPVVFNDSNPSGTSAERNRYMNELHAMLRDSVAYYIEQRKPGVSQAEIDAWQRANFAKAHQETYWTHYRENGGNIKMIRGDYGHGHGLVQIDDRWHFTKIEEGAGWDIFKNITYGMEIFFDEWERAATASCVSSPTNWRSRSRAAYAAYNGGPTKLCRWTNPNDTWARNDNGYRDKYDAQGWNSYIADVNLATSIDVPCFMEGNAGCSSVPQKDPNDPANWPNTKINLTSGESCIFSNNAFECVNDAQDMMCLNMQFGSTTGSLSPDATATDSYTKNVQEKHSCFENAVDGLATVGKTIQAKLAITMRATPGGTSVNTSSTIDKTYQVLDYVVNDEANQYRYYLIQEGDVQGYIYAGDITNNLDWTIAGQHSDLAEQEILIAQTGDDIKVVAASGISLRDVPNGELLGTIAVDTITSVENVIVQGTDNFIYYQVTDAGITGYIYGGKVLNGSTLSDWAVYSAPVPPAPVVIYPEIGSVVEIINAAGISLRATAGGTYISNIPAGTQLYVFDTVVQGTKDYTYYKVTYNGQTGYVYGGQAIAGEVTLDDWVKISQAADIAQNGEVVTNINAANQRQTAGGTLIQTIPAGQQLTVISNHVQGDNNYVYYEVSYNGQTGFIYTGYLSPASTVASWTTIN
jgi:hypothetical protein